MSTVSATRGPTPYSGTEKRTERQLQAPTQWSIQLSERVNRLVLARAKG